MLQIHLTQYDFRIGVFVRHNTNTTESVWRLLIMHYMSVAAENFKLLFLSHAILVTSLPLLVLQAWVRREVKEVFVYCSSYNVYHRLLLFSVFIFIFPIAWFLEFLTLV